MGGGGVFEGTFQRAIGLFLCQFMVFERGFRGSMVLQRVPTWRPFRLSKSTWYPLETLL